MKVRNMTSKTSGREIANQFIITDGNKEYFQSYQSIIALNDSGKITIDSYYWDYSVTTGKYRNQFLNENKKETQKKIDAGIYELADLNKD